jgi:hypothetical protein
MILYFIVVILLVSLFLFVYTREIVETTSFNEHLTIQKPKTFEETIKYMNDSLIKPNVEFKSISKHIYRPGNTTNTLKQYITRLLQHTIQSINDLTNSHFRIIDYDIIIVEKDAENNTKMLVDFFIHDMNRVHTKRLMIEILILNNKIHIHYIHLANARILNEPNKLSGKSIHNIGTRHILEKQNTDDLNKQDTHFIIGDTNTTLSYTTTKNNHKKGKQHSSYIRNRWTNLVELEKNRDSTEPFPCRKIGDTWNTNGIKDIEPPSKTCIGIDSSNSIHKRNRVGHFNPTLAVLPRDNFGLLDILPFNLGKEIIGLN